MSVPVGHCDLMMEAVLLISAELNGARGWTSLCFSVRSGKELETASVAVAIVKVEG